MKNRLIDYSGGNVFEDTEISDYTPIYRDRGDDNGDRALDALVLALVIAGIAVAVLLAIFWPA